MSARVETDQRRTLEVLSARLRDATCVAIENRSALARSLDEARGELERFLMLTTVDTFECRRATVRAQMMLDAWQTMAAAARCL